MPLEFKDRYDGLCRAMRGAGLEPDPALQRDAVSSEDLGYAAANSLLAGKQAFDAIFAASDLIAIGAMRALTEAGLRLPDDVAIIGFDDIPAASLTSPTLTTVMQDMKGAGTLLVDALLSRIEDRPVEQRMLPARLIRRQSTPQTVTHGIGVGSCISHLLVPAT